MKKSALFTWMLVLVMAAMFVVGCPEDKKDKNNPAGPNNGDLTGDELSDAQLTEVTEQGMIQGAQLSLTSATQLKAAFMNGFPSPNVVLPNGKMVEFPVIAEPPAGWEGPDNDGWYSYTEEDYWDYFRVRLTPDAWADDYDDSPLTRIEYMLGISATEQGVSYELEMSYWGETNAERTMFDGELSYTYSYSYGEGNQNFSYNYDWSMSWSDVSLVEGDYSGHYETSMMYPVLVGAEYLMASCTTVMDFESDATGTGSGSIAGEEYVRFVFEGLDELNMVTGYYTLKSEDWAVHHDFSFYGF